MALIRPWKDAEPDDACQTFEMSSPLHLIHS
jgi:hypothetical protein